jgi:hypothetical protein
MIRCAMGKMVLADVLLAAIAFGGRATALDQDAAVRLGREYLVSHDGPQQRRWSRAGGPIGS